MTSGEASSALILPGSSTSALVSSSVAAQGAPTGKDALNPHLLAMLTQGKVKDEHIKAIGDAGADTAAVFGKLGGDEKGFTAWCVATLTMDATTDAIPLARLVLVWEACRKRTDLESESAAQRAVARLPPSS